MQVLALSPEQINSLPPNEREAIRQLVCEPCGLAELTLLTLV